MFKPKVLHPLLIIIGMLALTLLLPIRGHYLTNDSYVYAKNVENFLAGDFRLVPITTPTALLPTTLGYLWSLAFGHSFAGLRYLTAVVSTLGLILFYRWLRTLKIASTPALLGTIFLSVVPWYLATTFSFMSEVYFLTPLFAALLVYQYTKGVALRSDLLPAKPACAGRGGPIFQSEQPPLYFLTSLFITLSFLARQLGFFLAVAFATDLLLRKKPLKDILAITALPLAVLIWYQFFYSTPAGYAGWVMQERASLLLGLERLIKTSFYVGLIFAPLIVAGLRIGPLTKGRTLFKGPTLFLLTGLLTATLFFWSTQQELMFYLPNLLTEAGFTPSELGSGIKTTLFTDRTLTVRVLITLVSIGLTTLGISTQRREGLRSQTPHLIYTLLLIPLTFFFRSFYDRYLLAFVPFLIAGLLKRIHWRPDTIRVFAGTLLVYGAIFIGFEADYLAMHQKVGELALKYGPEKTFATTPLNRYHRLDQIAELSLEEIESRSWLPLREEYTYIISYSAAEEWGSGLPPGEWETVEETSYPSLLGRHGQVPLFVAKNIGSDPF